MKKNKDMWVFPGQGSLDYKRNYKLYNENEIFKNSIDMYSKYVTEQLNYPIKEYILNNVENNTKYEQPAILVFQLSLINMWKSKGVTPEYVVGHSLGEFAAAVVVGIFSDIEALDLVIERGRVCSEAEEGKMAVLFIEESKIKALPDSLSISANNTMNNTVISGPKDSLEEYVTKHYKNQYLLLNGKHAFHSKYMKNAGQNFIQYLDNIKINSSNGIHFISTVTGDIEEEQISSSQYWYNHMTSPVKFYQAIKTNAAHIERMDTIIEMGSNNQMLNMIRKIIDVKNIRLISSTDIQNEESQISNSISNDISNNKSRKKSLFSSVHIPSRSEIDDNSSIENTMAKFDGSNKKIIISLVEREIGEKIGNDDSIIDSGLNSLGSISLRNNIMEIFKIELKSSFILDYPSINKISKFIDKNQYKESGKKENEVGIDINLPTLVIGAGIGGISFARELEKNNIPVVIMEATNKIGGVWSTHANESSKLQIDSVSYGFDCATPYDSKQHKWENVYPSTAEILNDGQEIIQQLRSNVHFNTKVKHVKKVRNQEYNVIYTENEIEKEIRVSGVAAFTGGLHEPAQIQYIGEDIYKGKIAYGIHNDIEETIYKDKNVTIVGHGAFAIENMRTALENGANHVTIVCRERNLVVSNICNRVINSNTNPTEVKDIVNIMRPYYEACGLNIDDLHSINIDDKGEYKLSQKSVPAGSDIYFLAQMLGKLTIEIGEIAYLKNDAIILNNEKEIESDILLKCIGLKTNNNIIPQIFGEDSKVDGLWINNDPNLFTYSDGESFSQALTNVKSLLCGSYLFFVQAFAPAYIHYRKNPHKLEETILRINKSEFTDEKISILFTEMWDYIENAKKNVQTHMVEECSIERFLTEIENEWYSYIETLEPVNKINVSYWKIIQNAITYINNNIENVQEKRNYNPLTGISSVQITSKKKVLFLSGQGINSRISKILLKRTGWLNRTNLDFVIPDAPFKMNSFTNEEQLKMLGLDTLKKERLYNEKTLCTEWNAGFDHLLHEFNVKETADYTKEDQKQWNIVLEYVEEIIKKYGPFDGIISFCEGSAVASVLLYLQENGYDFGLKDVEFFIAMSPWLSPLHKDKGLYTNSKKIDIPTLMVVGENDMDVFLDSAKEFKQHFSNIDEFYHKGEHVYPLLSEKLKEKIIKIIN